MSTPAGILKHENQGRNAKNPPGRPPAPPVNALPPTTSAPPVPVNRDPSQPPPPPVNPQPVHRPVSSQHKPLPPAMTIRPSSAKHEPVNPPEIDEDDDEEYEDDDDDDEDDSDGPVPARQPTQPIQRQPQQPAHQPQPPTMRQPQQFQQARPTLPGKHLPQIPENETVDKLPSALKSSQYEEHDGDDEVGIRNRVNSPQFQSVNLRGSEGIRSPPTLKQSGLMLSTDSMNDTVIYDARNHPQAHFARTLEQFTSTHRKQQLHPLKVIKIPVVEQRELRIKSYSQSQILETPLSIGADIYTALAYGIYGDSTLGNDVRCRMVDALRDIANWLEEGERDNIGEVVEGLELDDLNILFKYLILEDAAPSGQGDGAAGPSTGAPGEGGDDEKGKKVNEQGVVEGKKKKKKRMHALTRDSARDARYARALRQLSNDIANFDGKQGTYIHPLSLTALTAMLYNRSMCLFSVKPGQIKLHTITPPRTTKRLPVYLATDEKDTSMIYMMVPQQELHTFDENLLFFQKHVMETIALVPAYNEGEEEIMRTFMSFKKECKEEVQVIFFVDGVKKNGSDVNHNTLTALLKNFDFIKMGNSGPLARYGKDDLQALVADVLTLDDTVNATAEYMGQDRVDGVAHIALRVWVKKQNSGKKQSQLKFFDYLSKRCVQPRYLLFVDSDTRFVHPAVTVLKDALDKANTGKIFPEIGGTTGEIVVENLNAGFFVLGATQYFEYKMSHHLGKRAESSFGRVSCLAGAFSMFESRALMDPRVIADFSKDDAHNSIWEYNKKNLGEDRYLTAQLLEAGYGTSFEPGAMSHTVAPSTLKGFIAQRRRWDNSTVVNQVDLIFADKKSVFSLWGGRYTLPWVWNFIDFAFTLVMPGNMILLMVSIINSILRLSDSSYVFPLKIAAPIVAIVLWLVFFLMPFLSKNPNVLDLDLYLLKLVSAIVVAATILLFAYIFKGGENIAMIIVAVWVFLGPYAVTLIIRAEIVCMLCGPLFLLMTPVMFLFLKFYALANFGERSWGTRDSAAKKNTEKEQINTRFAIAFAGIIYLLINIGYMIVALAYPLYFMWVFSLLVSLTAITRLIASLALSVSLTTFRRMLGTVSMFDGFCAFVFLILYELMIKYQYQAAGGKNSWEIFYSSKQIGIFYTAVVRSFIIGSWYLGMRRGGWIVYGLGVAMTIAEVVMILIFKSFNIYGLLMAIAAIGYTIAEGFLVWKTNTTFKKTEDNTGLCCYLAFAHNLILLVGATILCYLPQSNITDFKGSIVVAPTAPLIVFAIGCGIWMWALHFYRPRAYSLVLQAIMCNMIYLIAIIICGKVLIKSPLDGFSHGFYAYVALISMVFQVLLSWTAVRWTIRLKSEISKQKKKVGKRATVNTDTGSMWPMPAAV